MSSASNGQLHASPVAETAVPVAPKAGAEPTDSHPERRLQDPAQTPPGHFYLPKERGGWSSPSDSRIRDQITQRVINLLPPCDHVPFAKSGKIEFSRSRKGVILEPP